MPFDLFISHSSKDNDVTRRIHDRLTAAGIETWVDLSALHDGDVWDAKIQSALYQAKRGLIVLSRAALNSTHCKGEWQTFINRKLPMFIVKIETLKDEEIPYYLNPTQITDLTTDVERKLTALIASMTGNPVQLPPSPPTARISGIFPAWQMDMPLYGREEMLSKVRAALDTEKPPHSVQITGIGGVGKSRLAAEIVKLQTYADGAIWHDCWIESLSTLAATIREHLKLPPMTDEQTWSELDKHALLLVLDNGEDCPEPAAYATVINRLRGQMRVILTTRLRWLELRAPERSLTQPDLSAATQIMEEFAAQKAPDSDLKGMAGELAEAAHRHPRLMEHAASWLNDMTVKDVLAELRSVRSPDAQEALNEMVNRSIERVRHGQNGGMAMAVLRKLAVCRGGFTREAAESIAGEEGFSLALKPLRNWGLLRFEGERYEIDPLVIETVGEDENAHAAHYDYYEALVRQHDAQQDYLGLNPESANLEAAFEWASGIGNAELSYWFANACSSFQSNRGRYTQRMDWLRRVEPLIADQPDTRLRAAFAVSWAIAHQESPLGVRSENLWEAISAYEQASALSDPDVAPLDYATAQNNLGNVYTSLAVLEEPADNLRRAIAAYEQALRFRTADATPFDYAVTQNNLGNAYANLAEIADQEANLRRAISANEEALRFWSPETAPLYYAGTQNNLGIAYRMLAASEAKENNLRRAINAFEQALRFRTPQTAPLEYAVTQANLGNAHRDNQDMAAAMRAWCEAEMYFRQMDYVEDADKMAQWVADVGGSCA